MFVWCGNPLWRGVLMGLYISQVLRLAQFKDVGSHFHKAFAE
jgi:hypothetical protein